MARDRKLLEDADAGRRRLLVGRGRRRRHDHLRRRARASRPRPSPRSCVERGGVAGDHEQRARRCAAAGPTCASRWRRRANLHQAMVASDEVIIITNLEWANRFAHVSAVKETCAENVKIASVEAGMGAWGLTGARTSTTPSPAPSDAMAGARGQEARPRHDARRHRLPRLHRGAPAAGGHAHQAARPDDGPGPAVGRGRLRRGGDLDRTAPPSSTA